MYSSFYVLLNSYLDQIGIKGEFKRFGEGADVVLYKRRDFELKTDTWVLIRKTSDKYFQITHFTQSLVTKIIISHGHHGVRNFQDIAVLMASLIN